MYIFLNFSKRVFSRLTCVPSAPTELKSALRHVPCRISCAFLKKRIEEFPFAWLSCSFLRRFSIFGCDFVENFWIQFSNFTNFPIFLGGLRQVDCGIYNFMCQIIQYFLVLKAWVSLFIFLFSLLPGINCFQFESLLVVQV